MIQNNFRVSLRKTEKIEVDKNTHALPPDNGPLQEFKVSDYHCPKDWSKDGVFVKVEEEQPLWIDFRNNEECACIPSVQRLNPITGKAADLESGLTKKDKQNYLVLPRQMWLDGYSKDGKVYQFVVTKAGEGLAVNEYVLPKHMQNSHAMGFAFFAPKNPKPKISTLEYQYPWWHNHWWDYQKRLDYHRWWDNQGYVPDNWYGNPYVTCGEPTQSNIGDGPSQSMGHIQAQCFSGEIPDPKNVLRSCEPQFNNFAMSPNETVDILDDSRHETADKASMGAGGRIVQDIISDNNTIEYYHEKPDAILTVYLALPEQFEMVMKKGLRRDESKEDRHVHSGDIGGKPIPLI